MSRDMMDALEITYRLRRLGKTHVQIARDLNVSTSVVNNVIHGRISSHAVACHIATLLGQRVEELWPTQYVFKPRGTAINRRVVP